MLGCTYTGAAWVSNGTTFVRGPSLALPAYDELAQFHVMDVNGDGKDDVVALTKSGTKWKRSIFFSDGASGFTAGATDTAMSLFTHDEDEVEVVSSHFLPADVDADGKTDLIEVYPKACFLCTQSFERVDWEGDHNVYLDFTNFWTVRHLDPAIRAEPKGFDEWRSYWVGAERAPRLDAIDPNELPGADRPAHSLTPDDYHPLGDMIPEAEPAADAD